jgi:hypothetical protein
VAIDHGMVNLDLLPEKKKKMRDGISKSVWNFLDKKFLYFFSKKKTRWKIVIFPFSKIWWEIYVLVAYLVSTK